MTVSKELLARYKELKAKGINVSLSELKAMEGVNDATNYGEPSQASGYSGVNGATSHGEPSQTADYSGVNDATSHGEPSQTAGYSGVNDATNYGESSQTAGYSGVNPLNSNSTNGQNVNIYSNQGVSYGTQNSAGAYEKLGVSDIGDGANSINGHFPQNSATPQVQSPSGWETTYSDTHAFYQNPCVENSAEDNFSSLGSSPAGPSKNEQILNSPSLSFPSGTSSTSPSFSIKDNSEKQNFVQSVSQNAVSPSPDGENCYGNFGTECQKAETVSNCILEDTINAPVKKFALIGYPLGHSLSSYIHDAGFKSLGIKASYEILETPPDSLVDRIKFFKSNNYLGFNVTIPLKLPVTMFLDEIDASANIVNAVNTVTINPVTKELKGYNTDAIGFRNAIPEDFTLCGKTAGVLGTGGAARAAITALAQSKVKEIRLYTRNVPNSIELLNYLRKTFPYVEFNAFQIEQIRDLSMVNLLVNTTPIGMQGRAADMTPVEEQELITLPPDALVYDVIYNPKKTILLKLAQKHGYRTLNGVDMFIRQAVAAEQIWTGRTPDFKDMKIAALENL